MEIEQRKNEYGHILETRFGGDKEINYEERNNKILHKR